MNPSDVVLPENNLNINIEPDIIFEVPDLLNEYPMYNINVPNVADGLFTNSRNTTNSLPVVNNQPASVSSLESLADQSFDDLLITMGKNYIYR